MMHIGDGFPSRSMESLYHPISAPPSQIRQHHKYIYIYIYIQWMHKLFGILPSHRFSFVNNKGWMIVRKDDTMSWDFLMNLIEKVGQES